MSSDIQSIVDSMESNQEKLLHLPGGLEFTFEITPDQRGKSPYFIYAEGLRGDFRAKWPRIYCKLVGVRYGVVVLDLSRKPIKGKQLDQREASYDFNTKTSVVRQNIELGQIIGSRTEETSTAVYPFSTQYAVPFSREFFPGEKMKSDYWLPNAIEQNSYSVVGQEEFEGALCHIVERSGWDKIWIAAEKGSIVWRRELKWGFEGGVRERMQCLAAEEVAPGVWLPTRIMFDSFDRDNKDKRLYRLNIKVNNVHVGNVSEESLTVTFPKEILRVEDYVSGVFSQIDPGENEQEKLLLALTSVQRIGNTDIEKNSANRPLAISLVLVNVIVILGIVIVLISRRT